MTIHEPEDSLVTRRVFQMDDKAQGARPRRPAHVMVGRFTRKGVRTFILQGVKTWTCIRFVLEGRLVLVLIGLHM